MAINLDADVGQIFKELLSGKKKSSGTTGDNKSSLSNVYYKKTAMKCVVILCLLVIILSSIGMLTSASSKKDQSEFTTLPELESAVVKIEQDIASSKVLLANNRKKVEEVLPLFSDISDSKSLFRLISQLAEKNKLTVKNLSQGDITEVTNPARFYKSKVLLEVSGYYPNFVNFKKQLEKEKPILTVDNEVIKLNLSKTGDRIIDISIVLIDYSVSKNEYEKILNK